MNIEEPFCVCGHDEAWHFVYSLDRLCVGVVGSERCTCLGYREGRRSKELAGR